VLELAAKTPKTTSTTALPPLRSTTSTAEKRMNTQPRSQDAHLSLSLVIALILSVLFAADAMAEERVIDGDSSIPQTLGVKRSSLALDVADREPVSPSDQFKVGEKVWAWVSLENLADESQVEMIWKKDGKPVFSASLSVGRSREWRTWSRRTMRADDVGAWTVEVVAPDGSVLEQLAFTVAPAVE